MSKPRVLIGCEFSGTERDAFTAAGCLAMSCDFGPSDTPGWHYQGNVLDVLNLGWDLAIFHPDCTYFTLAGARWFGDPKYPDRYQKQDEAVKFFRALQEAPIPRICIENPQPLQRVMDQVGKYDQKVQPWEHGEPESKGLCFWLKNLPRLKPTEIVQKDLIKQSCWLMGPSLNRKRDRARSFKRVAEAMASQWGNL